MTPFNVATLGVLSQNALTIATDGFIGVEIVIPILGFSGERLPGEEEKRRAIILRIRPSWSKLISTRIITVGVEDWNFSIRVAKGNVVEASPRVRITPEQKPDIRVRLI
jgi:hypothetical protein